MPPILDEDEALRAQAYYNYRPEDFGIDECEWEGLEEDVENVGRGPEEDDETEGMGGEYGLDEYDEDIEHEGTDADDEMEDVEGEYEDNDDSFEEEDEEEAETIVSMGWIAGD
jgi:hypothetical protein